MHTYYVVGVRLAPLALSTFPRIGGPDVSPDGPGRRERTKFHAPAAVRVEPKNAPGIRWASVASCSPATAARTSSRAYAPLVLSSGAQSPRTRTWTGSVSSGALRASLARVPRRSATAGLVASATRVGNLRSLAYNTSFAPPRGEAARRRNS